MASSSSSSSSSAALDDSYCNDVCVVDIGTSNARFGVASDALPRSCVPSAFWTGGAAAQATTVMGDPESKRARAATSFEFGYDELARYTPEAEVTNLDAAAWAASGAAVQRDAFEALLGRFLGGKEGSGAIFTESVLDDLFRQRKRAKISELLFEKFRFSSIFFSRTAPLACYACARTTGLVLDVGGGQFTCSPVNEGYLIREDVYTSSLGGNVLDSLVQAGLRKHSNIENCPLDYEVLRLPSETKILDPPPPARHSFRQHIRMDLYRRIKEHCLSFEESSSSSESGKEYVLPDGTIVKCEPIRKDLCDVLFNPVPTAVEGSDDIFLPLHALVFESASGNEEAVEMRENSTEFRRKLLENIVLCGGMSAVPGLQSKLTEELKSVAPIGDQPRVITAGLPHRQFSPWIGGSILGSLSTFKDMMVSKKQFDEEGPESAFTSRCP